MTRIDPFQKLYSIQLISTSIRIFFLLSFIIFGGNCKSESIPNGVPQGAKYDRKTNIYHITQDGKHLKYYKDGGLYESCEVNEMGIRNGYCESFLNGTGTRIKWGNFKNGQRDGLWVWTFEDGNTYIRQNFTVGKKRSFWIQVEEWGNEDGLYERFFPDGRLEEKGTFDGGYRTGDWVKYYPSGSKEYIGTYSKGKRVNNWIHYYPNGKIEATEKYTSSGDLIERITYQPNGSKLCIVLPNKDPLCNGD